MTKRKSKRLLSLLLSLAMVFTLTAAPVLAADTDVSGEATTESTTEVSTDSGVTAGEEADAVESESEEADETESEAATEESGGSTSAEDTEASETEDVSSEEMTESTAEETTDTDAAVEEETDETDSEEAEESDKTEELTEADADDASDESGATLTITSTSGGDTDVSETVDVSGTGDDTEYSSEAVDETVEVLDTTDEATEATEETTVVAKIGTTRYDTLASAFAAATSDDTITLTGNVSVTDAEYSANGLYQVSTDVTLDLNSYTLTVNTTRVFGILDGGSLTIKNGTVKIADGATATGNQFNILRGTCSFTAESVTFDGNGIAANFLHVASGGTATISLTDCNITNQSGGVVVYDNDGNSTVTLTGCNYATNPSGGALNTIANFKIVFNGNNKIGEDSTNWEASNSLRYTYVVTDGGSVSADLTLATTKGAASLTVEGGSVTGTVKVAEGTSLTVSGGTVSGAITTSGTFTMTGGTVTASSSASQAVLVKGGTVNISGGTISANSSRALVFDTDVTVSGTISGGTFTGNDIALLARSSSNNTVKVTGGTYTATKGIDLVASILADGYGVFDTEGDAATVSGNYYISSLEDNTVVVDIAVASRVASVTISETTTYYSSISSAVAAANAATESTTITLLKDVEIDEGQIVFGNSSAAITLDLAGYTISRGDSTYYALTVVNSGTTLTVQDSGEDSSGGIDATFTSSTSKESYAIWNKGTLNITGGTYAGYRAIYGTAGTLNVSGGTFSGKQIGIMASGTMNVSISKGTITGSSHSGVYMGSSGTLNITGGTISSYYTVNVLSGTLEIDGENVSIGGTYGVWCQGASVVATIKSGKIAGETGGVMAFSGADVTIGTKDSSSGPEISGSYEAVEISTSSSATASSTVKVYSGTLSGTSYGICIYGKNSTYYSKLYVYGGTITATDYFAITGNGSSGQGYDEIYIYGGTISSKNGQAIYHPQQDGKMYVYGGTITGVTGIEVRAGTVVIDDDVDSTQALIITATGDPTAYGENYSGATTTGAAIAIAQYNNTNISVTIKSGTFRGTTAVAAINPNGYDLKCTTTVAISGGTFTGDLVEKIDDALQISGGTYSVSVDSEYCADGYTPTTASTDGDGNTTYTVEKFYLGISTNEGEADETVPATISSGEDESVMYVKVSAANISKYNTSAYPTTSQTFKETDDDSNETITHTYIFAGWYSYSNSEYSAMASFPTSDAYAKFVDADVLKVICVYTPYSDEDYDAWRFFSSIDSLNYDGFYFVLDNNSENTGTYYKTYNVQSVNYKFTPTDISNASTYLMTYRLYDTNKSTSHIVQAYYVTLDGTKVYGTATTFDVGSISEAKILGLGD